MRQLLFILLILLWFTANAQAQGFLSTESIRSELQFDKEKAPTFIEGVITRVTDSESIWIQTEYTRDFVKWSYKLSRGSLDTERKEIRIWLKFVSPKLSVSRGQAYNDWFKKKVASEVGRNFYKRRVRIEYDYLSKANRLQGVVYAGQTNLNLWMIRNGWSFYLIENGRAQDDAQYVQAEEYAKANQLGLWKPVQ